MDTEEAYQAMVDSYLETREIPEADRDGLGALILHELQESDGLITDMRLGIERILGDEKRAYLDAQALFSNAYRIDDIPETDRSGENCEFDLPYELETDLLEEYAVFLAEETGERGTYEAMGERE